MSAATMRTQGERHVQLFRRYLDQRGRYPLSDLHFSGVDRDGAVRVETQPLAQAAIGVEAAGQLGEFVHAVLHAVARLVVVNSEHITGG